MLSLLPQWNIPVRIARKYSCSHQLTRPEPGPTNRTAEILTPGHATPVKQPSPALSIDLTSLSSGQRTPTIPDAARPAQRRRTTLISLIDELALLRDEEGDREPPHQLLYDEKRDARTLRVS